MGARSILTFGICGAMAFGGLGRGSAKADQDTFFSDLARSDVTGSIKPSMRNESVASPAALEKVDRPAKPSEAPAENGSSVTPAAKSLTTDGSMTAGVRLPPIIRSEWQPEHAFSAPQPTATQAEPQPAFGAEPAASSALPRPAAETLPPLNAALKAVLDKREGEPIRGSAAGERRKERAAISFFYAMRNFAPVWSNDGKATEPVASILVRLAKAGDDALVLKDAPPTLLKTEGTPEEIAASDLALTEAVVAYARQASGSRVDPHTISALIGYRPALADPADILDHLSAAGADAGDKLAAFNPSEPRYVELRHKLAELRSAHTRDGEAVRTPIAGGVRLVEGMRDARVPSLRRRLGLTPDTIEGEETLYDSAMGEAVSSWQRSHDLPATGALDRRTVATLNGDGAQASHRLEGTLIANMEMWRWMPRDLGSDRIEVNVPDYAVRVVHDGAVTDEHRVVVGKTDTPTPLFSNAMRYMIVNPYWNVPQSIIKKEMLPKGGGSLNYLDGRGYQVGFHDGVPTVKQLPGPKNALGQIKFLFPNDYSVYLHDTPSKTLFASAKRAFSHGCIRVDKPFAFAQSVLSEAMAPGKSSRWTQERLEGLIGDKERYINLDKPLPVHIEYFTATIEDGDRVKLREDIYGYAHAVATALGQESEPAPPPKPKEPPVKTDAIASRAHHRTVVEADVLPAPPVQAQAASRGFFSDIFDPR